MWTLQQIILVFYMPSFQASASKQGQGLYSGLISGMRSSVNVNYPARRLARYFRLSEQAQNISVLHNRVNVEYILASFLYLDMQSYYVRPSFTVSPDSVGEIFPGPATTQKVYQGIEWFFPAGGYNEWQFWACWLAGQQQVTGIHPSIMLRNSLLTEGKMWQVLSCECEDSPKWWLNS